MPKTYDPSAPYRAVGAEYMLAECRKIAKHLPGARIGEDPEHLHDVRVGLRRLRTAMVIFRACFPPRQYQIWYDRLSRMADALAGVRDMDVQLELIQRTREALPPEHQDGLDAWRETYIRQRAEAREEMQDVIDRWQAEGMANGLRNAIELMGYPLEAVAARATETEIRFIARLAEAHIAHEEEREHDV